MSRTFDALLIEQCAPTLAGIKPASLFCWQQRDARAFAHWAKALAPFGIGLRVLRTCSRTGHSLVYVYRSKWLRQILSEPAHRAFLQSQGYHLNQGFSGLLEQLSAKLCLEQDFPHEIGVFLGYPLEDVEGFIRHQGRHYTCRGPWKVYGDPDAAQRRFSSYRRCTEIYRAHFRSGTPVCQLVVSSPLLTA